LTLFSSASLRLSGNFTGVLYSQKALLSKLALAAGEWPLRRTRTLCGLCLLCALRF
jgi:hypothetical protein